MAIDSTLYCADLPAGSYSVGDVVPLVNVDGPANVRSGRGTAILKNLLVGRMTTTAPYWRIHVKNSDWIDEISSFATTLPGSTTAFDEESGASQPGHDLPLTENSGWSVYAECVIGGTSTNADSLFCLIDVDYPNVSSVTNPKMAVGYPTSINYDMSITTTAYGAMVASTWSSRSVDYFKAGYQYILDAVEVMSGSNMLAFVAFSNAAGMGGLQRIIPVNNNTAAIRYPIRYASKLTKGPMEIKIKAFAATATTTNLIMVHDFVKRGA